MFVFYIMGFFVVASAAELGGGGVVVANVFSILNFPAICHTRSNWLSQLSFLQAEENKNHHFLEASHWSWTILFFAKVTPYTGKKEKQNSIL